MNFPVVGGRAYLYEQTIHHKPIAGTLNFPNNNASRKVWAAILDARTESADNPDGFKSRVRAKARSVGVRYVVVHADESVRPDMHDEAVRALAEVYEPIAVPVTATGAPSIEVYRLW